MKQWMRKFAVISTAVALTVSVGSVAACSSKPGSNTSSEWWQTTGELIMDNGKPVFDEVEVRLSTVITGEDRAVFADIIAQFNAAYRGQISIVPTYISQASFESTVMSQVSNNSNAPDVIMSHQKAHKMFADNRIIQPLDEAIERSGISIDMSDYADGLAQYSSLGSADYLFSVPVDMQTMGIYYNKALLEQYGEKFPETLDDLIEICTNAKEDGIDYPIAFATAQSFFTDYVFPTSILQNGGELYDSSDYRAKWDEGDNLTAFEDAISVLWELIYEKQFAQYGRSGSEALNLFLGNQAIFYFALPWDLRSILNAYAVQNSIPEEEIGDYVGTASMSGLFSMEETQAAQYVYGDSHFFAMSSTVADITKKAAICEFIQWFTQTPEIGTQWAEAGHLSASKIVNSSEEYIQSAFISEYVSKFCSDINNFRCMGVTPYYSDLSAQLSGLFVNTMRETPGDIVSAIRTYQDNLNAIIDFAEM